MDFQSIVIYFVLFSYMKINLASDKRINIISILKIFDMYL